ncbi:hypothetical protein IWQ62_005960, partial [Dispira parvispora]
MGKRQADKELTQLNQFDNDDDHVGSGEQSSSSVASEAALAKRVIKKPMSRKEKLMAKRAKGGGKAGSAFAGFAGFGTAPSSTGT